jgi:ADP-ribose pyrophosphatase
MLKPWEILESDYVLQSEWISVRADVCKTQDGHIVDPYYVLETADWAQIIPFDKDNNILLVHQYRHGAGEVTIEVPCGVIDEGENPLECAKRELLEETGYTSDNYIPLGSYYPNPARRNNKVHLFACTDIEKTASPSPDAAENIEIDLVSIEELYKIIDSGKFLNLGHVASIHLAIRSLKFEV